METHFGICIRPSLDSQLSSSMRWNAIESTLYHAMLIGHQLALINVVPRELYGLIGAIFSIIYLTVAIGNIGFDITLSTFFNQATRTKQAWKHYIITQYIPTCLVIVFTLFALLIFFILKMSFLSTGMIILIGCTILSESLKKSSKIVLQLLFHNRFHAIVETLLMILYCLLIWIPWYYGYPITLFSVAWPLLLTSLLGLAFFVHRLYIWYRFALSSTGNSFEQQSSFTLRVVRTRAYSYINQLSTLFFTTNFQVPLFALAYGFEYAALFKFLTTLTYTVTHIIDKVFGSASSALFSQVKHDALTVKQHYFTAINWRTQQLVFIILVCTIVNHRILLGNISEGGVLAVCFFYLLVNLIDHCAVTYERLFIVEEVSHLLLMVNAIAGILIIVMLYFLFYLPAWQLLAFIACIRFLSFASLVIITHHIWGIRPSIGISFLALSVSFFISLVIFLFC